MLNKQDIINMNTLDNEDNFAKYENRNEPEFNRFKNKDKTTQWLRNTDFEEEAKYYNYYRKSKKTNYGNTLRKAK